jgi:hypothetical protein
MKFKYLMLAISIILMIEMVALNLIKNISLKDRWIISISVFFVLVYTVVEFLPKKKS